MNRITVDRQIDSPTYIQRSQVAAKVAELRAQGKTIVTTNGCFDLLHIGHVRYLADARAVGGENAVLIVAINSDDSVRTLKKPPRPYVPELERAEIIGSLKPVDYVTIFDELTPIDLIGIIRPDIHVKGGDYQPDQIPEREAVVACGGKMVLVGVTRGRSTTNIVTKILDPEEDGGN